MLQRSSFNFCGQSIAAHAIPPTLLLHRHATTAKAHIQRKFLNYYKTSSQTNGHINAITSHQSNLCQEYLVGFVGVCAKYILAKTKTATDDDGDENN